MSVLGGVLNVVGSGFNAVRDGLGYAGNTVDNAFSTTGHVLRDTITLNPAGVVSDIGQGARNQVGNVSDLIHNEYHDLLDPNH